MLLITEKRRLHKIMLMNHMEKMSLISSTIQPQTGSHWAAYVTEIFCLCQGAYIWNTGFHRDSDR